MRRIFVGLLAILALGLLVPVAGASAQTGTRCFPETGQCISGPIRAYWEQNGGLTVFGYPTTPQQVETIEGTWTGPTQWFERDRLEDHSNEGKGVLAGRLGAQRLEQQGRAWQYNGPTNIGADCQYFQPTGYTACGKFLTFWQSKGGLARFGYPITAVIQETIEGRSFQVQYFERRRMEYHPENAGTPYEVLLGLLGNEVRSNQSGGQTCPVAVLPELQYNYTDFTRDTALGCPLVGEDYANVNGATARFERGQMFWVNLRGGRSLIYVVIYGANNSVTYKTFVDTWKEGDATNSGLTPPAGKFEPNRGFGKVWREQAGVRDAVGWALENERAVNVSYQVFQQGALLQVQQDQLTWQFASNGSARNAKTRYY
ncbi:MAG: hypothetical protein H7Y32_16975 [Chloroflexales bacterium]|nr:hypothetical protein [Chloroflexales bacterium]